MKKTLRPFQQIGADFLAENPHALLGDDMGLGKTVQAIAAVEMVKARSVLVVCPASVRLQWKQEIAECLGRDVVLAWQIISYNEAFKYAKFGPETKKWDVIILDEVHYLKNIESQRTKAIFGNEFGLARRAYHKWAMTGTPVLNRPIELYPILRTLASTHIQPYDSFTRFAQQFCGAHYDGYGLNVKGASHLEDLAQRLKGFMLRRTKAEVMPELPPQIISRVPLSISSKEMALIEEEEVEILDRESFISTVHENFSALGDMARLLRLTGEAKVRASAHFINDLLNTIEKIVVFTWHREATEQLAESLELLGHGTVMYRGGMSDLEKQHALGRFKTVEGCRVFLGNIRTAGTGLDGLQKVCNNVVFAELSWVPGEMAQAIGRLDRWGQTATSVNVYVLHVPGTLESAVLAVQANKNLVINKLMGVA